MKYTGKTANEIMANLSLREKIGQMLMFDFRRWGDTGVKPTTQTELSEETASLIRKYNLGNVILFAENFDNLEQTVKLTYDYQKSVANDIPMLIGVDQEGGRIVRLTDGCSLPGNMALAATNDPDNAYSAGYITAKELDVMGMNVDFAPTLDVNNNPSNPIINLRSFSSDPHIAAKFGVAMTKGMHDAGIAASAKHFPGHGNTDTDSHTGLPCINSTYEELLANELVPFVAASEEAEIDMFMTTHIQFPLVETKTQISKQTGEPIYLPATLSKTFLTDVVRNKLNYKGIIITDSMQMQAISSHFGAEYANITALNAGVDILLMCAAVRSLEDEYKLENIIGSIEKAVKEGVIPMTRIDESVERVLKLKIKLGLFEDKEELTLQQHIEKAKKVVGCEEHRAVERKMAADGVTVLENDGVMPIKPKGNDNILFVAAYPNKMNSFNFAVARMRDEEKLGAFNADSVFYERREALEDADKLKIDAADYIIMVTEVEAGFNASKWQVAFPQAVYSYALEKSKKIIVISSYLPYDTAYYNKASAVLVCYCQKGMSNEAAASLATQKAYGVNIPAAIETVFGGASGSGILPVEIYAVDNDGKFDFSKTIYPLGYKK